MKQLRACLWNEEGSFSLGTTGMRPRSFPQAARICSTKQFSRAFSNPWIEESNVAGEAEKFCAYLFREKERCLSKTHFHPLGITGAAKNTNLFVMHLKQAELHSQNLEESFSALASTNLSVQL